MHAENAEKRRRTNVMIISIAIVFFVSWLPLNIFDLLMKIDSKVKNITGHYVFTYNGCYLGVKKVHYQIKFTFYLYPSKILRDVIAERETIIYALLQLFGMCTAIANPILYGYLNENFRKHYGTLYR